MSLLETCEWSDDYRAVVATIGPRYRVIVDRRAFGWTLQQRRERGGGHGRWFNIASLITSRKNLSEVTLPLMHSGYVKDHGITQDTVDAAFATLPERFSPEPTHGQLVINTRPPSPHPVPTSYKTAHSIT
ncbi:hypothetical protein MPLSOD_20041 [Mesorhizobium sp. SOD10]|nr:hypothetical protein MPLSOD_20041 [Mesorhizobium sp. SOD10]